jgi:hypothetical protein
MTSKFNHRRSSLLLVGLSIAVFLTTNLMIVNGQGYHNSYPYNDPQAALDRADAARTYQSLYSENYNPYSSIDPQSALNLAGIARANQKLYNYDSSDWEYWANLWLDAPHWAGI